LLRVAVSAGKEQMYRSMVGRAVATAEGAVIARDLANTPPNEAYPESMAERAREIGEARGIKVTVLGPKELEKRGMGGILAVGRGSRRTPRLAILEWGDGEDRISLVGKGVTFDTGGISIKPAAAMDEMKFDKCGACTVLGVVDAAAALDLPYRFRAYVALAENMPDGDAYRPGDIVRCYGGKTVEILNTDAEGRMLLADALALASEEGADTVLDYATLTGACVVALGHSGAGLFSPDDSLAGELLDAADRAGERLWRLPLWPEFTDQIKGAHGDLRNTGGRWGGASTAAAFLSQFVSTRRWAHLDIAGPAYISRAQKEAFGATGYGVALTIGWLSQRAG
jgi:leucyl aminopeptidase